MTPMDEITLVQNRTRTTKIPLGDSPAQVQTLQHGIGRLSLKFTNPQFVKKLNPKDAEASDPHNNVFIAMNDSPG